MDLLDRLLGHDEWTTRHLLGRCREVTDEQLHQAFDIGHETLYRTLVHVVENVEVWTDLLCERPVKSFDEGATVDQLIERFDAAYADFAAIARRVTDEGRLDRLFTDVLDKPPAQKTFGGAIVHLITHNMHHRSEILHFLKRLGVRDLIEGDALGWEMNYRNDTQG